MGAWAAQHAQCIQPYHLKPPDSVAEMEPNHGMSATVLSSTVPVT
jgi:hypothetical protein